MAILINKICPVCGQEVKPVIWKKGNRIAFPKFCSVKCRAKDNYRRYYSYYRNYWKSKVFKWRTEKECLKCGKKFLPNQIIQKYCSSKCCRSDWKHKRAFRWQIERKCEWCNVIFLPKFACQRFCSYECQYRHWSGSKAPEEKECFFCGKRFVGRPSKKYCSRKCKDKVDYSFRREARIFYSKLYALRNPDKVKIWKAKYYVKKKKIPGRITVEDWLEIKKKFNYTCPMCNKKEPEIKLTIDHIIPLSRGGKHIKDNIQPLCLSCNGKKKDKILTF